MLKYKEGRQDLSDCTKLDGAVHVDEGSTGKILFNYTWPILLSQIIQEMYNVADCAVVGRFAGALALAAAGTAALPMSVAVNFFVGFSSGISTMSSALFGSRDHDRLRELISSIMKMTFICGILLSVLIFAISPGYLSFTRVPGDVSPYALIYLRICSLGVCAQLVNNMVTALLRSVGDSSSPMKLFAVSALVNVIGDVFLVAVMKKGVAGAAAATAFSQWLLSVMLLIRLKKLDPGISIMNAKGSSGSRDMFTALGRGIPAGLQALFMSISSILIRFHINGFGSAAIAGMNVFARLEGLCYLPSFAFGIALTAFVGQNMGAKKPERIRDCVRMSVKAMILIMIPLSLALCLGAPALSLIFTTNEGVIANAVEAVRYTLPLYVFYAVNQVYLGAVKGMGNTFYPMICTLVCYALFRVGWCGMLLKTFVTMRVVYLSYAVSFLLMFIMIMPVYRASLNRNIRGASLKAEMEI